MIKSTNDFGFGAQKEARYALEALKPESKRDSTERARVELKTQEKKLRVIVEARDATALRAVLNSYIRLISVLYDLKCLQKKT